MVTAGWDWDVGDKNVLIYTLTATPSKPQPWKPLPVPKGLKALGQSVGYSRGNPGWSPPVFPKNNKSLGSSTIFSGERSFSLLGLGSDRVEFCTSHSPGSGMTPGKAPGMQLLPPGLTVRSQGGVFWLRKTLGKPRARNAPGCECPGSRPCGKRHRREGHRDIVPGAAAALAPLDTLEKQKNAQGRFGAPDSFLFQSQT